MTAHRVKFFRTAHHRVAQVYLRFAKHALEGSQLLPLPTLDRFRRAHFLVEMAFRCLGYAQHSGALPSGLVGEAFDSGISHSLEGKSVKVRPERTTAMRLVFNWQSTKN